jgi:hypothetical protein
MLGEDHRLTRAVEIGKEVFIEGMDKKFSDYLDGVKQKLIETTTGQGFKI